MRTYLKTGIFAIVLIVIAILYLKTADIDPEHVEYIYDFGDEQLSELSIINSNGSIGFSKVNNQWIITMPTQYKTNTKKIETIEKWIKNFPVNRVISEDDTDIANYGLDRPELTIEFKLDNGEEHTIIVGDLTVSKAQRYVKDTSKPYIYIVNIGYISQFYGRISTFRSKEIFDINIDKVDRINYEKDTELVIDLKMTDGQWYIFDPYKAKANEVVMNETLAYLRNLKAIDYVEEISPDLKQFGLDIPKHILKIGDSEGKEQVLEFGNMDGKGFIYMRNNGMDDIIKVFVDEVKFDNLNTDILLNEAPLKKSIDHIQNIEIETKDNNIEFVVDALSETYMYQDVALNKDEFITFYVKYINLIADGYEEWVPDGSPYMTLTSHLSEGGKKILKLYKRDENSYYMQEDDENVRFYINKKRVDLLLKWLDNLLGN